MTRVLRPALGLLAAAAVLGGGPPALARAGRAPRPVLVELFTAQGCATCPKANRLVGELDGAPSALTVTFSVDYWDYLGWSDTLAKPEFTARQKAYDERLKVRELYTPEVVVEGAEEAPALEIPKIRNLIDAAASERTRGPKIRRLRKGERVEIGPGAPETPLDVWLIRYDPQSVSVRVKSGENKGQTVVVNNAVRELTRLGTWRGRARSFDLPKSESEGLKTVLVLQKPKGGPVVSLEPLGGD